MVSRPSFAGLAAWPLILLIRLYQAGLSIHFGNACRFTPSCSAYAIESLSRYGAVRGGWLAIRRIIRCRPGGTFGYDPVPAEHAGSESTAAHLTNHPCHGRHGHHAHG